MSTRALTVSIVVPAYREERYIEACLAAIFAQTYSSIIEVFVVDGGSDDRTRDLAVSAGATVLDNPNRVQSSALNIGIAAAKGDVIVRVDGHCAIAADYVERCIDALTRTGAAIVGGAMTPVATTPAERAVAVAMSSSLGAGPARFHVGGHEGPVDTVYLGAYRTSVARRIGGYATDVGVNEDAEFAHRMSTIGVVWFDPLIKSTYVPRGSAPAVARQFWRYGLSRAATLRRHPGSISWRQIVAPALVLGLLWKGRTVGIIYGGVVLAESYRRRRSLGRDTWRLTVILPSMHLPWGAGMLAGLLGATARVGKPEGRA